MLRTRAVDERPAQIHHLAPAVEHPHPRRVRHVGHVHRLDVLLAAVTHELLHVLRLDDYRHALLRLADGQLRGVQTAIFRLHPVEVDVQTVGQLADRHADTPRAEVVRFLDEARHLRTAEQPFEFPLLGGVALLHLAAARLQRFGIMLLRRTRRSADAVAARPAAEHDDLVPRSRAFAPHVLRLHGSDHGAHFQTLGHVILVVDLAHVRRRQSDLVAVARIARRGLLRDDALRQFPGEGLRNRQVDVPGTRHAHRLVDVAAARQRVADRTAQTGRRTAEGFDLRRVVVRLVLELQKPRLGLSVNVHLHIDRAGVVLLRDFQIVQQPLLFQVAGSDRRHVHQTDALVLAPQLAPDPQVQSQRILDLLLHERLLDGDAFEFGREGRMAAVVAPIGIQNAQLRLVGVAALLAEVLHHLVEVVGVHRQPHPLAVRLQPVVRHLAESVQHLNGLHLGLLHVRQHREVLLARLHGVDVVVADPGQFLFGNAVVEEQQLRRADVHLCFGVDQPHAVHRRGGPLVELPGQALHGDVFAARKVARIAHLIGHHFAEDRVTALFEQLLREAEQVVDVQQTQFAQRKVQVRVQFAPKTLRLHPEARQFLDENTIIGRVHLLLLFVLFLLAARAGPFPCSPNE